MKSTAEDKGDHWLLNGTKTWISNASIADVNIYYAYTERRPAGPELSAFVVELEEFQRDHRDGSGQDGVACLADR